LPDGTAVFSGASADFSGLGLDGFGASVAVGVSADFSGVALDRVAVVGGTLSLATGASADRSHAKSDAITKSAETGKNRNE